MYLYTFKPPNLNSKYTEQTVIAKTRDHAISHLNKELPNPFEIRKHSNSWEYIKYTQVHITKNTTPLIIKKYK